ncbi:MAG: polyprenyl synthetase family protein [Pyrinomonadaceae bacterium]
MTVKFTTKVNELWQYSAASRPQIERAIEENLPFAPSTVETQFNEAVRYAVFPGGKRLRPVLTMLGAELFGGNAEDVLNAAAAVEFIHTSSLIFDDLPCMDDSPHRRGKLALHEKFGEGLANLVAIGFLNQSYQMVTLDGRGSPERTVAAILEIVQCVGPGGMVGGQSVDLMIATASECRICSRSKYGGVLNLKTSALIRLALRLGAILSGGSGEQLDVLTDFAEELGHAYQISDDIIDMRQDAAVMGNTNETDTTRAAETLAKKVAAAKRILTDNFPPSAARTRLTQLVDYVAERKQ